MRLQKTETGQAAFKERSHLLSSRQRSTFIMFDGKRTVADILLATSGLGITQEDVDYLLAHGFLEPVAPATAAAPAAAAASTAGARPVATPLPPAAAPVPELEQENSEPRKLTQREEQQR